jgi:DNA topoisomerase IA
MSPNIIVQTPYVLNYDFTYLSTKTIFDGWKILNNKELTEDYSLYLDNITNIKYNKITSEEKCLDQEYHYSEAQLIKKLEKMLSKAVQTRLFATSNGGLNKSVCIMANSKQGDIVG